MNADISKIDARLNDLARLNAFQQQVNRLWHSRCIAGILTVCGQPAGVKLPPMPEIIRR